MREQAGIIPVDAIDTPHVDLQDCGMRICSQAVPRAECTDSPSRLCVPGLGFDSPSRHSRGCGAGDKSRTERVTGVAGWIKSCCFCATLHDLGNGIWRKALWSNSTSFMHRTKHRPISNAGGREPSFESLDRTRRAASVPNDDVSATTLLIGLASWNRDQQVHVRRGELNRSRLQQALNVETRLQNPPGARHDRVGLRGSSRAGM